MEPKKLADYRQFLLNQGLGEEFVHQLDLENLIKNIETINAFQMEAEVFPYTTPNFYINETTEFVNEINEREVIVKKQVKLVQGIQREMDNDIEPFPFFSAR